MKTIIVRCTSDHCDNLEEIQQALEIVPDNETVALDFQTEAPCVRYVGVEDVVKKWCDQTNRSYSTVFLVNYPNPEATTVFCNRFQGISHFLWTSERYRCDIKQSDRSHLLGLFVGRITNDRKQALIDIKESLGNRALISVMDGGLPGFVSLDGHKVQDQYDPQQNTNLDLLDWYDRFDIELVMETYCRGSTFFPTEKIFRPIMAGKPFIVYGPKNFLQNLRQIGFETFSSAWDESYDQYEGEQRWAMIKSLIDTLAKDSAEIDPSIMVHNHNHLRHMSEKYRPW